MKKSRALGRPQGILKTAAVAIGSTLGTLAKTVGLAEAPKNGTKKAAKSPPKKTAAKKNVSKKKPIAAKKTALKKKK